MRRCLLRLLLLGLLLLGLLLLGLLLLGGLSLLSSGLRSGNSRLTGRSQCSGSRLNACLCLLRKSRAGRLLRNNVPDGSEISRLHPLIRLRVKDHV
ncbi:MAG: hypothetical protein ABIJ56_17115 [Pseudomonadota bacterium]